MHRVDKSLKKNAWGMGIGKLVNDNKIILTITAHGE